ncbi:MAG TPA: MBL fold metallo-hydrolase [Acidimicrobiales bacterium]|jgi:ribonuclease BN (tRNA processing enzyme)|nr:MBL fold metallo-hydrolase [Acidimicrobiales bacterium]
MGLTVTVLGSSGSYAGPGQSCSGYLVSADGTHVWVDCGPGTLANLQEHISLGILTGVVTSHAHADHWVELTVAHVAFEHYVDRSGVPVFGTAETRERLEAARGVKVSPTFDWQTVTDGSSFEIGGLRFTCAETDHPVETLALRIDDVEGGSTLVYSADTGSEWPMSSLGDGIDVALCEATLPEEEAGTFTHLTAREAGQTARDAGAGRLVITHLAPGLDPDRARRQAAEAFGEDVDVAIPHLKIEL